MCVCVEDARVAGFSSLFVIVMLLHAGLSLVPLLLCNNAVPVAVATVIETFSDSACQKSYNALDGPNGYPNGVCTQLRVQGEFGSFQVVQKDKGCTGMEPN